MTLLNHNIKFKDQIYHIQTEKIDKNGITFGLTQIFLKGVVVWSNKKVFLEKDGVDISTFLKRSHKNGIIHLKSLFVKGEKVNFSELKDIVSNFKNSVGYGVLSVDIFSKKNGISISGYNTNRYASKLFNTLYTMFYKDISSGLYSSELEYYYLMLKGDRIVIVGKIGDSDFMYGILVNLKEVPFGLLTNILIPDFIKKVQNTTK